LNKQTRNLIQRATQDARRLLEGEFAEQLEALYDVLLDSDQIGAEPGSHLDEQARFVRELVVNTIAHERAKVISDKEAVAAFLREASFTTLNRFAALKMMEARRMVQECVSKGVQSAGFREFCGLASGLGDLPDRGYRLYLECLFDEVGIEVGVLFDRRLPSGILWPRRPALIGLLEILNQSGLAGVWAEDETIGWIYQYYNDEGERRQMREESPAPRNSRELAVRNQFFTPRYVVEFLTDNTLGRLWYEMTQDQTRLKEQCRYLVRRPIEIFLKPGESEPESASGSNAKTGENLTQEELLRQPVHIPHRPLKDPREIRLLDPACGSMHFGLYAFDLFSVIYDEAWEVAHGPDDAAKSAETFAPFVTFADSFPDKAAFLREVPRLIIEHNIHGIDIDPRAVQIAGLSVWLRAQRAWHQAGVKPADRPRITRSNLVCAEPMPGERELLREFVEQQFPPGERPAFAFLLEKIFDRMTLAGEAGSLLRIEEEIRAAIAKAKRLWKEGPEHEQATLFPEAGARPGQGEMRLDLSGITDEQFWDRAEQRIYEALEAYAEQAENGGGFQRRLFADDAVRGFAFIDLCRKRYDVVVMNPPFGDASLPSKPYIDETYGDTKGDVYKAFVECFHDRLLPFGYLGIISSRTGFFLGQSEDWRTRVVLRLFRPIALVDLGMGVLDSMVEVAAYVLRNLSGQEARDLTLSLVPVLEKVVRDRQDRFSLPKWQAARGDLKRYQAIAELENLEAQGFIERCPGEIVRYTPLWREVKKVTAPPAPLFPSLVCIRALADKDKATAVLRGTANESANHRFVCSPGQFETIPGAPFAYWVSNRVRALFRRLPPLEGNGRTARRGPSTGNDFRVVRVWWEVPAGSQTKGQKWVSFAKGGKFSPFYADPPAVVAWDDDRYTFSGFFGRPGRMLERLESSDVFFRPGITWPLRGIRFSAQAFPAGGVFSIGGKLATWDDTRRLTELLAIANSTPFDCWIALFAGKVGGVQYESGLISKIPFPEGTQSAKLGDLGYQGWAARRAVDTCNAVSHAFVLPSLLDSVGATLAERAAGWAARVRTSEETVAAIQAEIDDLAFRLYGLDAADRAALTAPLVTEATGNADTAIDEDADEEAGDAPALTADLLAYALGCVFGRWDIRYATGDRPAPESPDPFAPLPVCPPGMLQGDDGLPLSPEAGRRLRADGRYPLDVAWDGILVDDPEHPLDLERRVHAALAVVWGDRADALEHEACALLGVPTLREWFRRPAGFFADHLKRYSRSPRQAPIFWPLSTTSGSYTVWLYYHRFHKDTFYRIRELADEKLQHEERKLFALRQEAGLNPSSREAKTISDQAKFVEELREFRKEVARVVPLWNPDLNDGVLINFAPFHRLISHPKWRRDVTECWEELAAGDYNWSHLAMHLWPERVIPKCATDRSLAIAHGLDEIFWEPDPAKEGKYRSKTVPKSELERLIAERTSPAVKSALAALESAPKVSTARRKRAST
jgi:hypothetical protein